MTKYDLSILIPARNELFLARTVQDLLEKKRGKTEIIVGLDGQWADPGIPDHDDVRLVYYPESIGQRALTNQLCRLSTAKWIAKLDAHCSFDEGFDQKLLDTPGLQDNWTIVPTMRNLHAFDWVCKKGHRRYQGPSGPCTECGQPTERDVLWFGKPSPQSTAYRFDKTLHFQYFNEFKKRPEGKGDVTPSMSLQGSFFMLTRNKYWELDICDEKFGSWGQQGTEVACKTWLSGGEVMVNQTTWYAHMFRTQGGDFSFPYEQKQKLVDKAREYSRELFLKGTWAKAVHPLQWLIDKFAPVPDWEPSKGIIYFTDNQLPLKYANVVQRNLLNISRKKKIPIVSASLKPMPRMGKNIHIKEKRGYLTMFKQILAALEASESEIIYFAEHDVIYPPDHFDFVPPDKETFYYDQNWWKVHEDGVALHWDADQVSGLVAYRDILIEWYRERIATFDDNFDRKFEPGSGHKSESWFCAVPHIDIRHGNNLTFNKRGLHHFRKKDTAVNFEERTVLGIPGWKPEQLQSILEALAK